MRFELPTRRKPRASTRIPRIGARKSTFSGGSSRSLPGIGSTDDGRIRGISRSTAKSRRGAGVATPRRKRPSALVRRSVVLGLVLLSLGLLTFSYRDSGVVNGAQMVVLEAVQPIERGLTRAWAPIQGTYDWGVTLFRATGENPDLRKRVDILEAQLSGQRQLAADNERLQSLLAMKERGSFPSGYRQVVGVVIARSETASENSFVIDLGTQDGIAVNDPVMVAKGLVGRVQAVSPNAARVALIINREQAVSATVVGSEGGSGILTSVGNEGSPVMQMKYVSQRAHVRTGDLITTSGWSSGDLHSIYPKGIPIGVVSSVGNGTADLYKTVQVTPFADFDRIDEAMVLVSRRPRPTYIEPVAPDAAAATAATRPRRTTAPAARSARAKRAGKESGTG